jgi:hypothetical protein
MWCRLLVAMCPGKEKVDQRRDFKKELRQALHILENLSKLADLSSQPYSTVLINDTNMDIEWKSGVVASKYIIFYDFKFIRTYVNTKHLNYHI